ncbi:rCG57318 [Rattus norvegicus]|uniref:RCG57318 n=1 Tax=Rattus norvegicus TaxID=10116 RepID=A6JPC5_RAT|nr:rCG57318 [Rattus norvegicus]
MRPGPMFLSPFAHRQLAVPKVTGSQLRTEANSPMWTLPSSSTTLTKGGLELGISP